jgi:hypothetical protein
MPAMKTWLVTGVALLGAVVVLLVVLVVRVGTLQQQVDDLTNNVASLGAAPAVDASGETSDDVCRFLGAWAAKNDVDLGKVFTDPTVTPCETTAMATYSAVRG